jgi:hypothetical protein
MIYVMNILLSTGLFVEVLMVLVVYNIGVLPSGVSMDAPGILMSDNDTFKK